MSIGCLSTQNVGAEIKPKLIFLNTRLCRQKRMINLHEFYPYPTDNGSGQAAGELRAPVMTGSVKGFGCRPVVTYRAVVGPASESLRGRNLRAAGGRCAAYGDLISGSGFGEG
jgi:hypothetical protein